MLSDKNIIRNNISQKSSLIYKKNDFRRSTKSPDSANAYNPLELCSSKDKEFPNQLCLFFCSWNPYSILCLWSRCLDGIFTSLFCLRANQSKKCEMWGISHYPHFMHSFIFSYLSNDCRLWGMDNGPLNYFNDYDL